MSRPGIRSNNRRTNRRNTPRGDLWDDVPELPAPASIRPPAEPAALVRSLGDPPLGRHSVPGGNAVAAVVERASMLATALAASAGLLATDESDGPGCGQGAGRVTENLTGGQETLGSVGGEARGEAHPGVQPGAGARSAPTGAAVSPSASRSRATSPT